MTEKELKKLSRLELLELLLEESKENERLKAELEKINAENSVAKSMEALSAVTEQMNSALEYANALTGDLQKIARDGITVKTEKAPANVAVVGQNYPNIPKKQGAPTSEEATQVIISDRKLYWRIMYFYSQNEMALAFLPPDIRNDVRTRIKGILENRK